MITRARTLFRATGPHPRLTIQFSKSRVVTSESWPSKCWESLPSAIGGFAGLRHAELVRLEWQDVKLAQGHMEVTAKKAKNAQRRIVPISDNLAQWPRPYVRTAGLLFKGHGTRFLGKVTKVAGACKFAWPQNALRHSYASYRLAVCKSAAEVALDMGNSLRMVFEHYRELVTPVEAEKWWSIQPADRDMIILINTKKAVSV